MCSRSTETLFKEAHFTLSSRKTDFWERKEAERDGRSDGKQHTETARLYKACWVSEPAEEPNESTGGIREQSPAPCHQNTAETLNSTFSNIQTVAESKSTCVIFPKVPRFISSRASLTCQQSLVALRIKIRGQKRPQRAEEEPGHPKPQNVSFWP